MKKTEDQIVDACAKNILREIAVKKFRKKTSVSRIYCMRLNLNQEQRREVSYAHSSIGQD